jgi:acetyl-CoA/propionyl-CoA carboxylase biotin carboxyl carrier protein
MIANRGEIAVRVIRACQDSGLASLAVYADQDRNALFARLAGEAFALDGTSPGTTYLAIDKLIAVAKRAGADAVHPGYGFLAENAGFAQAVIDAGLTWIGPPPKAIRDLGDKTVARQMAASVGAPLAPGLSHPVLDVAEIRAFVAEHGLPILIKAAFGGGGRGMKVVRSLDELDGAFESAVRESTTAFGRGECFVEAFLEHARHLETQCLADSEGHVVVLSTRDCSLQRRSQKLVEEAPAPFLTDEQEKTVYEASKAILAASGYENAGTCEFLLAPDGTISFNEVNTRLQVEHPVTEIVTGIDVVREQLRIAAGGLLDYGDPPRRGHAIEFRINGEDPGNGFMPSPGVLTLWRPPMGPGVRYDGGYEEGETLPGEFDSLLGKLVVYGEDRQGALAAARRALSEFRTGGIATVVPFHRAIVDHPDFFSEPFKVHTRWIEDEFDTKIEPYTDSSPDAGEPSAAAETERRQLVVEVDGRRVGVTLPASFGAGFGGAGGTGGGAGRGAPVRRAGKSAVGAAADTGDSVTSPMQATVVKIIHADGDAVTTGEPVVQVEAMKMEQPLRAPKDGIVSGLTVAVGEQVQKGQVVCRITEPAP